ncbi:MAG: alkaline phosphatase, partial [Muribaculaceae bacterium]|nr:alkaline phosphatase [Muribaculaceae bacterium]
YNREILKNDKPLQMMQFPTVSWCMTYSANSRITDSAAAGTALSTGVKTKNSMLGMSPDTIAVESIAKKFHDNGYGVGIVTSVSPFDATPGAFYAHVPNRSKHYEIGCQAAESGYEFLAGAGSYKTDEQNVNDVMAKNKVQVIYGPSEIEKINSKRVFLINPDGCPNWNIGYTIDSIEGRLTLPLITETCLAHLEKNTPDRFFMMVEGGNIDHALHANDGGAAIIEIINFNDALKLAYNFYLKHPDETLIVVTADHDTGGMAMIYPKVKNMAHLGSFSYQRVSKEEFSDYCKGLAKNRRVYQWDDMKEYLTENFGLFNHIPVSEAQESKLKEMFEAAIVMRNSEDQKTLYANFNAFAVEVFRLVNDAAGVGFTTLSHSGNPVPVFAVGAGAEKFTHLNNNNQLPKLILEAAGL